MKQIQNFHISIPGESALRNQPLASYIQATRIFNNRMKGSKLQLCQYRQKQQLKAQSTNTHNIHTYTHLHQIPTYYQYQYQQYEDHPQSHLVESGLIHGYGHPYYELANRHSGVGRTGVGGTGAGGTGGSGGARVRGVLTADQTIKDRRLKLGLSQEDGGMKGIMVTSSGWRGKSAGKASAKIVNTYFLSNNLDNRGNDSMNLMIRVQGSGEGGEGVESIDGMGELVSRRGSQVQPLFLEALNNSGMIPHTRKLNNFERRMKIRRKIKSESKQKVKINLEQDSINLKNLSKTLTNINHYTHSQSPLVHRLEYKTIFGRRGSKSDVVRTNLL